MKIHLQDLDKDSVYTEKREGHSWHFPSQAYNKAKRWFKSQIGNKFDDVFSKWVKLPWIPYEWRNKEKFGMFVELNVVESNAGLVSTYGKWGLMNYRDYIYVDSAGFLRYMQNPRKRYVKPEDTDHIILTDYTQYAKIDGIWFHVTIPQRLRVCWSLVERGGGFHQDVPKRMKYKDFMEKFPYEIHRVVKRSLSGKELRKAGLKNDNFSLAKFYECGM